MTSTTALSSSQDARLQALRDRHAVLSEKIEKAQNRLGSGDIFLKRLKKQKLIIKEEIERLRGKRSKSAA